MASSQQQLMAVFVKMKIFYEAGAEVGKSGIWDPCTQQYYYVDILKKTMHVLHVPSKSRKDYCVGTMVGAMALCSNGEGLVMAVEDGFGMWNFHECRFHLLATPYGVNTGWRMNDGGCDSRGRFWAGRLFKTDETRPGEIYRLETDGCTATCVIDNICCTNGILWSPNNKLLYCGDSSMKKIYVWDYEEESGTPCNRRLFMDTSCHFQGVPDGATIDNNGFLWVCFFDGHKLVRISPEGCVDLVMDLPVKRPTQPVWYGDNLDELLITSAHLDVDMCQYPQSGNILWLKTCFQGALKNKYNYRPCPCVSPPPSSSCPTRSCCKPCSPCPQPTHCPSGSCQHK